MMALDSTDFPWPEGKGHVAEAHLAKLWGLSSEVLAEFRRGEPTGWERVGRSHSVAWVRDLAERFWKKNRAGARALELAGGGAEPAQGGAAGVGAGAGEGGGDIPPLEAVLEKKPGPVLGDVMVTGRGWAGHVALGVLLPGGTEEVRVLAKRAYCLRYGAVLRGCTPSVDAEGFWEFLGHVPERLMGEGVELRSDLLEGGVL